MKRTQKGSEGESTGSGLSAVNEMSWRRATVVLVGSIGLRMVHVVWNDGLFHHLFSGQEPWLRYLSDSSYWLHLVHIPLLMYLQFPVRDWEVLGVLKFLLICCVSTLLLLLSYQLLVRKTWLGVLLDGRRHLTITRPSSAAPNSASGTASTAT